MRSADLIKLRHQGCGNQSSAGPKHPCSGDGLHNKGKSIQSRIVALGQRLYYCSQGQNFEAEFEIMRVPHLHTRKQSEVVAAASRKQRKDSSRWPESCRADYSSTLRQVGCEMLNHFSGWSHRPSRPRRCTTHVHIHGCCRTPLRRARRAMHARFEFQIRDVVTAHSAMSLWCNAAAERCCCDMLCEVPVA